MARDDDQDKKLQPRRYRSVCERPDPFALRHGAVGVEGGFAIFPDEQTGFAALKALLMSEKYQSRTILETMKRFAPASDHNDPIGYAKALATAVNAPATTKL